MLNNIVDNLEQCGQQNIVQCCFHQVRTGCAFFAVYAGQSTRAPAVRKRQGTINSIRIISDLHTMLNVVGEGLLRAGEN